MLKFLFMCDGNSVSGFGHLSRCANLIQYLKLKSTDIEITLIGSFEESYLQIFEEQLLGVSICNRPKLSLDFVAKKAKRNDILIVDSYLINQGDIDLLATSGIFKLILIDDFCKFNYSNVDLVINFTVDANQKHYNAKKSALGLKYFLHREALDGIRKNNFLKSQSSSNKITIFFSGTNYDINKANKIIQIIDSVFDADLITVVANQDVAGADLKNSIKYCKPSSNFVNILSESDLIITGGGLIKYESAFCIIPNISIAQNKEQEMDSIKLEEQGLTFRAGNFFDKIEEVESRLIQYNKDSKIGNSIIEECKIKFVSNSMENVVNEIFQL